MLSFDKAFIVVRIFKISIGVRGDGLPVSASSRGFTGWMRASQTLELELQVVVNALIWIL